jgi:hypothetical protein
LVAGGVDRSGADVVAEPEVGAGRRSVAQASVLLAQGTRVVGENCLSICQAGGVAGWRAGLEALGVLRAVAGLHVEQQNAVHDWPNLSGGSI